jgi:hypothetical protein
VVHALVSDAAVVATSAITYAETRPSLRGSGAMEEDLRSVRGPVGGEIGSMLW